MTKIVSVVGKSNQGKTRLIQQVVPLLKQKGYTVCVVKHSTKHLTFKDFDHPGTDTFTFSQAGADEVWLTSPDITYHTQNRKTSLNTIIASSNADFIITEGFSQEDTKKIVIKSPGDHISVKGEIILTIDKPVSPEEIVDILIHS
ncbi:MAG: molybdopterin-guanine dinucleotide biosynthesis protein B [Candidatus Methanofastidiosia archaeon]|jgi:molybdopterin-guanine dinucleotide biosynthesis protein MobB